MQENSQNLNSSHIEAYYDLFDKGCMTLVEKGNKRSYLEAFIAFASFINNEEIDTKGLDNRTIHSLSNIMDKIFKLELYNEEVREALMLLLIKGLKHEGLPLDYITPDTICYLLSHIITGLYEKEAITIIDTSCEMGILDNGLLNNLENEIELIGITNDEKCARVASSIANLCMNEMVIYQNDPLSKELALFGNIVLIKNNEKQVDYILKYSETTQYQLVLIDNDFFSKEEVARLKTKFKGTMLGLIVLPTTLFQTGKEKSILILTSKKLENYNLSIIQLPSLNETDKLQKAILNMTVWLKQISFKNIYNDEEK